MRLIMKLVPAVAVSSLLAACGTAGTRDAVGADCGDQLMPATRRLLKRRILG